MSVARHPTALLLLLVSLAGCASHSRPATPRPPAPPSPAAASVPAIQSSNRLQSLRADLDSVFLDPAFDRALWAVMIQSLATGEVLYELNSRKLVMPASNMKIITLAATAERLGWDFKYETTLVSSAPIENGRLRGDLIVVGSGDPTIGSRNDEAARLFDIWADELRATGISGIDGRIIGDDNRFDDEGLGAGWSWDYLALGYAAPGGALQYNEDTAEIVIRAPQTTDEPVAVELRPDGSGLKLVNRLVATPAGTRLSVELRRLPGASVLELIGSVPVGTTEFTRMVSVDNPTEFFARVLRSAFVARGIDVRGEAVDIDSLPADPISSFGNGSTRRVLVKHLSPPLSEMARVLMKVSQNLYADTFLKTLGSQAGTGTAEAGRQAVREVLSSWEIPSDAYVMYDGSGLSRYNYVTAEVLVRILSRMHGDSRHAALFEATLPVAGVDGTLAGRMKGTRAEGNVRAKTGSIANVRSLSGYVRTADGEPLAFSIIANHFNVPQAAIDSAADLAAELLAGFTRNTSP